MHAAKLTLLLLVSAAAATVTVTTAKDASTLYYGDGDGTVPPVRYVVKNFTSLVDHFSFINKQPAAFTIRYLVNDTFYKPGGPILFYTGNEGSILTFAANTLIMWQLAPQLQAALIFVEHRYYGNSMPFGGHSFDNNTQTAYLTAEQALADFAYFLENLGQLEPQLMVEKDGVTKSPPVIAFGGSYGGMLAAWIRQKYPHLVLGAIAASAPVRQFINVTDCYAFMRTVTKAFKRWGSNCAMNIGKSWAAMQRLANQTGQSGLTKLGELFHTCAVPSSLQQLTDWLNEAYVTAAMVNYPYAANFLLPLPAWPVQRMCAHLNDSHLAEQGDTRLVEALSAAVGIYYNYTGRAACLNLTASSVTLDDRGWSVQSCNEMVMPDSCADGVNDMFQPTGDFNLTQYSADCMAGFGIRPRPNWAMTQFGGVAEPTSCTNIFFSNGDLDPWSAGGVLRPPNRLCPAFVIKDGAHHLDLRAADPRDPPSVTEARRLQLQSIHTWLSQYKGEGEGENRDLV